MKKVLFILHQKTSVSGDVGKKFKQRGFVAEIVRPPLGDILPNNLSKYSAVVIFGGPMSVNDDEEFIKNEIKWMKNVIDSKIPFLGICLGAQILAKYLGCEVVKNKNDLAEIGFFEIKPVGEGNQIFKNQNIFYQFHTEGFELPTTCQLLAKGDIFKNPSHALSNVLKVRSPSRVELDILITTRILVSGRSKCVILIKA